MSIKAVSRYGQLLTVGAILALSATASPVRGAELVFDGSVDTCTTQNCGAVFLNGITQKNAFGDSVPFTLEVFNDVNNCIRLEVTGQTADMEIVLVSPSGGVWRNDDFFGNRPLITARGDVKGYYTIQINYFNGNQPINTGQGFVLAYGRYVPGTAVNCPTPAAPFLASQNTK